MSDNKSQKLLDILKNLPNEPGIYRMLDINNTVLYVGKAANLRKRVSSYFNKQDQTVKTRKLVSQIQDIEITITNSETEALLLECNLIKALRPKYNVLMRDDKSYPYIEITLWHDFPSIQVKRSKKRPNSDKNFFGPYPSVTAVRETMNLISKVFKIRTCSDSYFNARSRPCLQYQIGRCSAPCTAYISKEDYKKDVIDARRFLQGEQLEILQELSDRMQKASDALAFEEAAVIRDQIKKLRLIQEDQAVIKASGNADVIVIQASLRLACVVLVRVRDGEVLDCESFFPTMPDVDIEANPEQMWQQIFNSFIAFYYLDVPERMPKEIITDCKVSDHIALENMLFQVSAKKCHIKTAMRGKSLDYIMFARKNLNLIVNKHVKAQQSMLEKLESLADFLSIEKVTRLECFDISHTQGNATVASCVVFDENGPLKKDYRRFNINNITKGDDYAALYNAISRRFSGEKKKLPNVLLIDGGKGQVNIAQKVMQELKLSEIIVLGVAKGRTRKAGMERLIIASIGKEQTLPEDSNALHLIQHIRDEAHRFAISAHRRKRQKESFSSGLESIEGIGAKRRQAILRHFGGLREIAKAPVAEIAKVNGISLSLAKKIYQHFH